MLQILQKDRAKTNSADIQSILSWYKQHDVLQQSVDIINKLYSSIPHQELQEKHPNILSYALTLLEQILKPINHLDRIKNLIKN